MSVILNIDSSSQMWDPACPVLLPLGPITISSIIPASMGVFVPFLIFTLFFFYYLYTMWMHNIHESKHDFGGGGGGSTPLRKTKSSVFHFNRHPKKSKHVFSGGGGDGRCRIGVYPNAQSLSHSHRPISHPHDRFDDLSPSFGSCKYNKIYTTNRTEVSGDHDDDNDI